MFSPTPKPYANIAPMSRYQANPEHGMNPQGDKPVPVLGPQPPLPGATAQVPVRYTQPSEVQEDAALVPNFPYYTQEPHDSYPFIPEDVPVSGSASRVSYQHGED